VSAPPRRRPALIALALLAATGCLALGWWQWTRFESNAGTFQNLGYALQWPMFAVFCIYAYRKFVILEANPETPPAPDRPTEIPEELLPPRPGFATLTEDDDPVLAEYNRYLADLAAADGDAPAAGDAGTDTPQDRTTA